MASRNLRSGLQQKGAPQVPAEISVLASPTPTATPDSDFEKYVKTGIEEIKSMFKDFQASLEFQSQRTTALEKRVNPLETKMKALEKKVQSHELSLKKMADAENKLERFSRRNNFRVVGLKEEPRENPMEVAKLFLSRHFRMDNASVERAHRDGPRLADKPRHFLVKLLSYQDKRYVMSHQRSFLAEENMYVIDDLTKKDREEKRTWTKQVQEAFKLGVRYHFSGGKWRDGKGNVAPFCAAQLAEVAVTTEANEEPPALAPVTPTGETT